MGAEWIRVVAATGDGDPVAGTDEHDLVVQLPPLGRRAPSALELEGDRGIIVRGAGQRTILIESDRVLPVFPAASVGVERST